MAKKPRVPVQRYTTKQLALLYGCSVRTIIRYLNRMKISRINGHFFSTQQVIEIFEKLGEP